MNTTCITFLLVSTKIALSYNNILKVNGIVLQYLVNVLHHVGPLNWLHYLIAKQCYMEGAVVIVMVVLYTTMMYIL